MTNAVRIIKEKVFGIKAAIIIQKIKNQEDKKSRRHNFYTYIMKMMHDISHSTKVRRLYCITNHPPPSHRYQSAD